MSKKESETKEFIIPEALPFGYSFMMFVEYVVDRVPEFQSVAGARKGAKIVDAVEAAEKDVDHIVRWPTELWKAICKTLDSEQFQMPRNFIVRAGIATDQLVPLRLYLPMAEAILEAQDKVERKSEMAVAERPEEAPPLYAEEAPAVAS